MQSFAVARPRCVCFPGRHEPDHFMLATMPERTRCVGSAMSYTTATVIVVLCTLLLLASRADALRSCGSTAGWLQVTEDCVLQPLTANADSNSYSVVGVLGAKGLPAVHADPEAAAATTPAAGVTHPGGLHLVLQQLVLMNCTVASPGATMPTSNAQSTAATATGTGPTSGAAAATGGPQSCDPPLLWPLELLPPPPCTSSSSSGWRLVMTDVRILVPPQQLAALLPAFQGREGVYTDNATFLHIISADSPTTRLASVTLLTPDTLLPGLEEEAGGSSGRGASSSSNLGARGPSSSPHSSSSAHLSVDNTTLVPLLLGAAATPTPAPLLLFLTANVSLGAPPAPLAATGFPLARPVYLVGLVSTPTSIDFQQVVNQVNMTGPTVDQVNATGSVNGSWAKLHLFQLALENLGYGDVTTARWAGPFSALVVGNVWAVVFNRTGPQRMVQVNNTMVVPPLEVDYLTWSTTLYSNPLPYSQQQTAYLHKQMSVQYEVVPGPEPRSLIMVQANTGARAVVNTTVTATPVAAALMPRPPPVAGALAVDKPAPSVGVADSAAAVEARLLKQNSSSARQDIFLVTTYLHLGPGDQVIHQSITSNMSSSNSSSSGPAGNSTTSPTATAAAGITVNQPTLFAGVAPGAALGWGYRHGVLLVPQAAQPEGFLQLQQLRLEQLPQGPAPGQEAGGSSWGGAGGVTGGSPSGRRLAAAGQSPGRKLLFLDSPGVEGSTRGPLAIRHKHLVTQQQLSGINQRSSHHHRKLQGEAGSDGSSAPEAWTLLLWGVERPLYSGFPLLSLAGVELLLPPAEHAFLLQQAAAAPAFLVPLRGLSQGLSLQGVAVSPAGAALHVAAFRGPGVVGTNLTLLPDPTPPPPGALPWPFASKGAVSVAAAGASGLRGKQLITVGAVVPGSVVVCAAVVVAVVCVSRRRQRRNSGNKQQQQQQQQKGCLQLGSCGLTDSCCVQMSVGGGSSSGMGDGTYTPPTPAVAAAGEGGVGDVLSVGWDQESTAATAATGAGVLHVVPCAGLGRRPDAVLPRLRWTRGGSQLELPKDTPAGHPGASQVSLVLGKWQAALAAATGQILGRRVGRSWGDAGRVGAGSAAVNSCTGTTAAAGVGGKSGQLQAIASAAAAAATEGDVAHREAAGGPLQSPPAAAAAAAAAAAHAAGQQQAAAPAAAAARQVPPAALAAHHRQQQQQQQQQQGLAAGRGAQAGGGGGSTSSQASGTGGVPGLQLERPLGEGAFGTVFAGTWRGKQVAVKVVQYRPAALHQLCHTLAQSSNSNSSSSTSSGSSGEGRGDRKMAKCARRHEAVIEAAVAAHVCHPNIVQVYTYSLKPILTLPFAQHTSGRGGSSWDGAAAPGTPPAAAAGAGAAGDGAGLPQQQQGGGCGGGVITSWELHLVMEYCDQGSLREALDRRLLCRPTTTAAGASSSSSSPPPTPLLPLVLYLAHDIAAALVHLHAEGIAHGDIKAANVLLTSGGVVGEARRAAWADTAPDAGGGSGGGVSAAPVTAAAGGGLGVGAVRRRRLSAGSVASGSDGGRGGCSRGVALTAKLTDFGLAVLNLDANNHITYGMRGTPAYMSPELLLQGRVSKASDVYALGVLLWELATGRVALQGVPLALLPHQVAREGLRPTWPAPLAADPLLAPLRRLVEACWAADPGDRPTAEQVMHQVEAIQAHLLEQQHDLSGECSASGASTGVQVQCGASDSTSAAARAGVMEGGGAAGWQGGVQQEPLGPLTASWTMG